MSIKKRSMEHPYFTIIDYKIDLIDYLNLEVHWRNSFILVKVPLNRIKDLKKDCNNCTRVYVAE